MHHYKYHKKNKGGVDYSSQYYDGDDPEVIKRYVSPEEETQFGLKKGESFKEEDGKKFFTQKKPPLQRIGNQLWEWQSRTGKWKRIK